MTPESRRTLLEAVFSTDPAKGAGLSALRLNIGASDYSTALYTCDDVPGDTRMEHFSVAHDDRWLFPMVKESIAANPAMFLFAAPWSPPGWMKDGGRICGGRFKGGFEEAIANYVVAYVKACGDRGIGIGAVNVQNEPFLERGDYPTCAYTVEQLSRATIALARRLREEGLATETWFWDFNYDHAEAVAAALADPALRSAIRGVAWHSYEPSAENMGRVHRRFPDIPFYHTEHGPARHAAERTERWWCDRVFGAFNNGCRLFTAWNLCLTDDGQPVTGPFTCTGLVDVDPDTGEFEPSALYRVLRHIGPFVKRGARLLHVEGERDGTATVLFRNPDGSHALVVCCSGRAEGRDDTPRARVHVKFRDEWLSVPLPIDVWSLTTVVFAEKA